PPLCCGRRQIVRVQRLRTSVYPPQKGAPRRAGQQLRWLYQNSISPGLTTMEGEEEALAISFEAPIAYRWRSGDKRQGRSARKRVPVFTRRCLIARFGIPEPVAPYFDCYLRKSTPEFPESALFNSKIEGST